MTKSDDELVARLIAELDARGEDFTRGPPQPRVAHRQEPPPPPTVAEVIRRVWGEEALEHLTLGEREGQLRIAGQEPCVWLEEFYDGEPFGTATPLLYERGSWVPIRGLVGWKRLVTSLVIDLLEKRAQAAVLAAFSRLVTGTIVATRDDADRLLRPPEPEHWPWDEPPVPADPLVVELFEPPHFEGQTFVFQVNLAVGVLDADASFARIAIDASTGAIDVRRLARGLREGKHHDLVVGRAYVDEHGTQCLGPVSARGTGPAAAWLDAARAEHASVASFARASMELMAVGAPLDLVRRTHEAALDEIRHTELSLDVARRFGAVATLGALPALAPRASTVVVVATTTLLEAAVNETLAAFSARVAAKLCADDDVRRALLTIAADEERHAALAWDVITWACGADGDARSQIRALAPRMEIPASGSRSPDDACGQLTARTEREAWRVAFEEKVRPRLEAWAE